MKSGETVCTYGANGTIVIPKYIRQLFQLEEQDKVIIKNIKDTLLIEKEKENTLENKGKINKKGAIYIPVELKRFLFLEPGMTWKVFLNYEDQSILLKPDCRRKKR